MMNRLSKKTLEIILGVSVFLTAPEAVSAFYKQHIKEMDKPEINVPYMMMTDSSDAIDKTTSYKRINLKNVAAKSIENLNQEEEKELTERLSMTESKKDNYAISRVLRKRLRGDRLTHDTIYSIGENQINISPGGALEDYNEMHSVKFKTTDMFNRENNRAVRDWYLFERIPYLLRNNGLSTSVANSLAVYNAGIGTFLNSGGDAISNFEYLPEKTQDYVRIITGYSKQPSEQ